MGTVTITDYAQQSLGDVVFVELPSVGTKVAAGGWYKHIMHLQNLNLFYGVITECCNMQTCPTMSAGPTYVDVRKLCRSYHSLTFLTKGLTIHVLIRIESK